MYTVPAYVDWRACTATPLAGIADYKVHLKLLGWMVLGAVGAAAKNEDFGFLDRICF
jgi:hypothetical protein